MKNKSCSPAPGSRHRHAPAGAQPTNPYGLAGTLVRRMERRRVRALLNSRCRNLALSQSDLADMFAHSSGRKPARHFRTEEL